MALPLVTGFFVDVDHFLDYAIGRLGWGHGTMLLPLHGWEYLPLLGWIDRRQRAGGALLLGYLLHLSMDQLWNEKRSRLAYFLTWRARQRFASDTLGPPDPRRRHVWRHAAPRDLVRWF